MRKNNDLNNLTPEQEALRVKNNEAEIDRKFEYLTELIGRELTEKEEDDFLDIVDEYTPKDRDGNYLIDLVPFDYAWEIYEARKKVELDDFLLGLEVG